MKTEKAPTVQNRKEYRHETRAALDRLHRERDRVTAALMTATGRAWFDLSSELSNLNATICTKNTVLVNLRTNQPSHGHEIGGQDSGSGLVNTHSHIGNQK